MKYYQQGDILIKKIENLPGSGKVLTTNILKDGGNNHLVYGDFWLIESDENLYLQAINNCTVAHAEHNSIPIEDGIYKIEPVMEYDHFLEESKEVVD